MNNKRIIVAVTTLGNEKWREQIADIEKLQIKEFAFFPTALETAEREESYQLLDKLSGVSIPLVHIRHDMAAAELEYFRLNYQTEFFNHHSTVDWPLEHNLGQFRKGILIENSGSGLTEAEVKKWGGVCLDLAHLESDRRLNPECYNRSLGVIAKYTVKANHLSALLETPKINRLGNQTFDSHHFTSLSEFDYLKQFPASYFSQIIALELTNSIGEQLQAQAHLEKTLNL